MKILLNLALFLRDEFSITYNLIPSDITILFILASHLGEKDWWYISQPDLAKECRLKVRQLINRLKKLEKENNIVKINRTGKANKYGLILPYIPGKLWCSDMQSNADHKNNQKSDMQYSAEQICNTVQNRYAIQCTHKETKIKLKKERGASRAHSLSVFVPDESNTLLCQDLKLNMSEEVESFKQRCKAKGELQYEFGRWLKLSFQYKTKNNVIGKTEDSRPKYRDYTEERLEKEKGKIKNPEPKPKEEEVQVGEYMPWRERMRLYKLKQQGGLPNGHDTNQSNDTRGRTSSE